MGGSKGGSEGKSDGEREQVRERERERERRKAERSKIAGHRDNDIPYCSTLWHSKHINDTHSVVIHKLSQHQPHHLHGYSSTAYSHIIHHMTSFMHQYWSTLTMFEHLGKNKEGRSHHFKDQTCHLYLE